MFAFAYLVKIGYLQTYQIPNHRKDVSNLWIGSCIYFAHTALSLLFIWLLKEKYDSRKANAFTIQIYTFFSITHQYFPRISPFFAIITPIIFPENVIILFNAGIFVGSLVIAGLAYLVYRKKYQIEFEENIISKLQSKINSKEQSKTQLPPLLEMQKSLDFFYQN
ncbi:hypothetical protein FGO68_gene3596 [Halteria grandinella]|uniref:Uncharacterized protein n=1 Tax=Halteria grandinella TaxID=5974 RepID=A0A8J8NME6_HALGN|nr:hypothetical protein FGO68_gene3596 [Halteria grandinella]